MSAFFCVYLRFQRKKMHANRQKKAFLIKRIVDDNYIPQSHRGCLVDIYRRYVRHIYPMSAVTFYRLIEYAIGIDGYIGNGSNRVQRPKKHQETEKESKQLSLF